MRIFFAGGGTGGHLYPALAVARAVTELEPAARPLFIGAQRGIEREILPSTGFEHVLLDLHPLYRTRPWRSWRTAVGFATAWRAIGAAARQEPPLAVVGTGGYAAATALAWATWNRVPYAIQEQNSYPGLTVRTFSHRARELWLGFPEAASSLRLRDPAAAVDTGNPITPPPSPRPERDAARASWGLGPGGHVLLVSGGSQGALALNEAVAGWVREGLPPGLSLIWGAGRAHFHRYRDLEAPNVRVRAYLDPMADAYAAADLALTRAGAMTTAELCAWGLPMVLVPLPTAAADHQTANAVALEAAGAAIHLPQAAMSVQSLREAVAGVVEDPARAAALASGARARGRPDAAAVIAGRLLAIARGTAGSVGSVGGERR